MATPVLLPKQGNSVESCLIVEWKKNTGDTVSKGDILCEVETDKAVFEVLSPADGVLLEVFYNKGDDVPVMTNIAMVGDAREQIGVASSQDAKPKNVEHEVGTPDVREGASLPTEKAKQGRSTESTSVDPGTQVHGSSPRARGLIDKFALSAENIVGTGPGNRIIERDVLAAARTMEPLTPASRELVGKGHPRLSTGSGIGDRVTTEDTKRGEVAQPVANTGEDVRLVPLKGIRKIIAGRMLDSVRNSAQMTLNISADAIALLHLRKRFKESSHVEDLKDVTITDLLHCAVIRTLPAFPDLNSLLVGDSIEYHKRIHLGFAVDTPRGLIVPVIRNSQDLNLLELSHEAKRLTEASRSGKIVPEELNGATFTVTNLGGFGIETFTPILNLPQTAILGVNAISQKPIDRGNGIAFVPHIGLSLTVDHRAIDGALAARFLRGLASTIAELDLSITMDSMRK